MSIASSTYSPTVDTIIRRALRQCVAIQSGETPGAQEYSDAFDALNAMVAEWQATGLHLWTETEGVLFTQPNQISYSLGGTNTDFSCTDANWVQTALSANAPAAATSIPLASTAGINSGDNIGILLYTNALFWTTVTAPPSGGAVTIATGLPSPVNVGSIVVDYAPAYQFTRPLRIMDARRFYLPSGIETPLIRMARLDYRDLPDKPSTGTITQYFYDPQLAIGKNWLWPAPPDSLSAMKFTAQTALLDFANASDTPDFPQEWLNALAWNLAEELAPEYGVGQQRMGVIAAKAAKSLEIVQGWDREPESVYFGVNFDQTGR